MSFYEGLSCPVCNESFTEESDIVVCPKCGLPHHRRCWAIENHCHEADKHDTPEQWSREKANPKEPSAAETDEKVCPNCSKVNTCYAEFCARCGADLESEDWHSASQTPPPAYEYRPGYVPFSATEQYSDDALISNISSKELAAVVGSNTPYYISRFRRVNQNKTCGWNWAACLLGPLWLLYRKQYWLGGLAFVIDTVCTIVYNLFNYSIYPEGTTVANTVSMEKMMESPWFQYAMAASMVLILMRVLLGIFGNNLYLTSCVKRIRNAKLEIPDISSYELSTKGGVSLGISIAFYFLSSIISNAALLFFIG